MSYPIRERPSTPIPCDDDDVIPHSAIDIAVENSLSSLTTSNATPKSIFYDRVTHHASFQELETFLSKMVTIVEKDFKIAVVHAVAYEVLEQIVSNMASITEVSLLEAMAHYPSDLLHLIAPYPSSLLQEIADYPKATFKILQDRPGDLIKVMSIHSKEMLRELSRDFHNKISRNPTGLVQAVEYFIRLEGHQSVILSLLIKLRERKIPLTHNSLHVAIIHKMPKEILRSILACVNPTRTSFILALVHGTDAELLSNITSRIQITDGTIAQIISNCLSPEALESFLKSIPKNFSPNVIGAILKKHKQAEDALEIILHEKNNLETAYKKGKVSATPEEILERKTHSNFKKQERINEILETTLKEAEKAITEDTLIFAIRYGNSNKIITILLNGLQREDTPLTINTLHAAIECGIDSNFIKYFIACINPTEYSFILALKNEAEFLVLVQIAKKVTLTEEALIHIFTLPLQPGILESLMRFLKGFFSIKLFEVSLRHRKDKNILLHILDQIDVSIDVLILALKYKAPDTVLIPLADEFSANPQHVLDLAIRYQIPSVISHMQEKIAAIDF